MIEFFLIVYFGINFASALFFYVIRYDVEYLLGGESSLRMRVVVFFGMLLFGTLIIAYIMFGNIGYVACLITKRDDDYSICSSMRTSNNFYDIRFGGEGD